MTDPNERDHLIVQRFVDNELSADERVRLLRRVGRDDALRQRVIELEELVTGVSRLPRPLVPDQFVARVMERTRAAVPAPPAWRRWIDALWTPRPLQWNLASAAAACVTLLALGAFVASGFSRTTSAEPPAASQTHQVLVRLVVIQPGATSVQAAGDFNGWNPARTPLEETAGGAWTVTIPLEPGRYEYMFVVDGRQWIVDPFAVEQSDDGFGSRNAVLEVRPPAERQGSAR